MIRLQSVKLRLTVWYAFILTLFLSLFAFLMHAELARALYKDVDKTLIREGDAIEDSMDVYIKTLFRGLPESKKHPSWRFFLPEDIKDKLSASVENWEKQTKRLSRSTMMIRLVALDHGVLLSNLTGWEREIIFPNYERDSVFMETGESLQTIHFQKKPIRLYYRLVTLENRPIFVFQCGISILEVKNTLQRLAFIILILIPGAVAAACVVGWFLVKRAFHPVDVMIREARQITAAYLPKRLPRTQAGDELDRLAETLNEMMDRIESSTRAIQDFSSDISHELKTPLAIIRGEVDLALRRSRSTEDLIQTLRVIEGEVNELIRLVDDLILLVRSDAKQLHYEMKRVFLEDVLKQIAGRFKERAEAKKIQFNLQLSHAEVLGDEIYLKRLFGNLLDNAIKFTPEGGMIDLVLKRTPTAALVEVRDNGMGIEVEMQAKVFSRFYRTDQARSHEGAGLGLNIAKTICESHRGSIEIASEPEKGTLVTVSLPIGLS